MRVLLIDDSAADTRLICEALRGVGDTGIDLRHASCLDEGLLILESSTVDVLLLDLNLPESRGLDTFRRASRRAPGIPILALTGNQSTELACQAVREGAQDYLVKCELDGALLVRAIRYACERKQVEEALRQERDFAESLIEAAQTIVLLIDMDGRLVRMNDYFRRVSGFHSEETWGQDWLTSFIPRSDQPRLIDAMREMLQGRVVRDVIAPLNTKDKRFCEIEWHGRRITDPKQHVIGMLLIGHDVTELREAQERALRSERLAAIGQMVTGLAHESRNALQRSQACLERLALRVQGEPDALDLIGRIQKAQDDLQYLYDEVRAYAAPIKLHLRHDSLSDLFEQCWHEVAQLHAERPLKIRHERLVDDLEFEFDGRALAQVFRNVLNNAVDASGEKVAISVCWHECELADQRAVRIEIADFGPGLSPEEQEKIFEPFFTTKTHGTGLGMPIAKRIVESHGGLISATSNGHGTQVSITLPRRVS